MIMISANRLLQYCNPMVVRGLWLFFDIDVTQKLTVNRIEAQEMTQLLQ